MELLIFPSSACRVGQKARRKIFHSIVSERQSILVIFFGFFLCSKLLRNTCITFTIRIKGSKHWFCTFHIFLKTIGVQWTFRILGVQVALGPECGEEHGRQSCKTVGSRIWASDSVFLPSLTLKPVSFLSTRRMIIGAHRQCTYCVPGTI